MQASSWWTYEFPQFEGFPADQPEQFIDQLLAKASLQGLPKYDPPIITGLAIAGQLVP